MFKKVSTYILLKFSRQLFSLNCNIVCRTCILYYIILQYIFKLYLVFIIFLPINNSLLFIFKLFICFKAILR